LSAQSPYLSIVVTGRNDDYGGNFLDRINVFVNQTRLWSIFGLDYELIIVEWNPLPDRLRLRDAVTWPECTKEKVRFIEVTEQTHRSLPRSNSVHLYEFLGKNVGIRRAKGVFILSTNFDILFSVEVTKFLASRSLSRRCFYRTNRYDLDSPIPRLATSVKEQLKFCEDHFTRINLRGETLDFHGKHPGLRELTAAIVNYHLSRLRKRKLRKPEDTLHTNASGDFMLMSRASWDGLRGHPENFVSNSHIDAFMCAMAASSGLEQVILDGPMRVYHQIHKSLDDSTDVEGQALYSLWVMQARRMLDQGKPIIYNAKDWGLAEDVCRETHF